jgi:hypothetical protein
MLLLNALGLIARCGLYQRNIEDWEQKPLADHMWTNLHPFIQETYQQRQSGYAQSNRFASLATSKDSDNDTADTIPGTIHMHMANITTRI